MSCAKRTGAPEAAIAAALLVAACAHPGGLETRAQAVAPGALHAERTLETLAATGEPLRDAWWKRYGDAQLDALVDEALASNPSLDVARARVAQARAQADAAHAALLPNVSATASASRNRLSEHGLVPPPFGGTWIWQNDAALRFDHEFDFWGRNRSAYEAALGQARAAEVDAQAARLVLATALARAYVQLQAAFDQHDIAEAQVVQRARIVDITRARVAAGLDSQVELHQAEGAVPQARDQRLAAEQAMALARHQLAALAGAGPDRGLTLARPHASARAVALPAHLPADLVGRRPDIVAQRLRIEASARGIESARAAFYPNIDLTGFVGLSSLDFRHFLDPASLVAGIGPAVRLPIFDRGTLRASLAARNADWDLAVGQYNQLLVDALREVVDQAATLRIVDRREAEVASALGSAEQAQRVALERFRGGVGNYLQVLSAQTQLLAQRSALAELRARRLDAGVALIRALGGGYEAPADRAAAY